MSGVLKAVRRGPTLELTLNRPECRNALSRELVAALTAQFAAVERDPELRAVIITGTPPAFCAGLDLRELTATPASAAERDAAALLELYDAVDRCSKPVIAAVNGPAVAGGALLICACDLVICASSAVIGFPQIRHGLVATVVPVYLRRLLGERATKFLLLTGQSLTARRAAELGLCNEVVADEELPARARYYAELLAGHSSRALARTKQVLRELREAAGGGAAWAAGAPAARRLAAELRQAVEESEPR